MLNLCVQDMLPQMRDSPLANPLGIAKAQDIITGLTPSPLLNQQTVGARLISTTRAAPHHTTVRIWRTMFGYGFRPFFLFAAIDALANMAVWLCAFLTPKIWPRQAIPAMYWHAHEMLFGFVGAAIAGFLLTAVPGWTGRKSYSGAPLMTLFATWLAGRIAMLPGLVPEIAAGTIDLIFFPALALTLAPSLIKARKIRNLPFLLIITGLFLSNLSFHLGLASIWNMGIPIGLGLGLDIVTVLIVIVGGRIIPAFTKSGLARFGVVMQLSSSRLREVLAIGSVLAMFLADMIVPNSVIDGLFSLLAGCAQLIRLSQWQSHRTFRDPLIWVLHLGYLWLGAALLLKGIFFLTGAPFAEKWIHAFTVGTFTTMIIAVMTRASLGHTGRALIAPKPISTSYLLISVAGVLRIFGGLPVPNDYDWAIAIAGIAWIASFAIFIWVYAPILSGPRADGKPG